jgi:flagellar hook-associated protein 3 FlgL
MKGASYVYQGSQDGTVIPLGNRTNVIYNDSGARIFGGIKTGNGSFNVSANSNNTGNGVLVAGGLTSAMKDITEEYKITMVTNGSGQLAYQLVGTSSGQLIPKPPMMVPADAPAYVPGQDIVFNEGSVQITGEPRGGDVFNITPSQSDNIFNVLQNVISTLSQPVYSGKDRADLQQALTQHASTFKQASSHFQAALAEVGSRGKMIDDYVDFSKNSLIDAQIARGQLADADMEQVISELTQRLTVLEVTQQSYLKIQDTYFSLLTMRG